MWGLVLVNLWLLTCLMQRRLLLGLLLRASQPMALQSNLGGTSSTSDKVAVHVLVNGDIRGLRGN